MNKVAMSKQQRENYEALSKWLPRENRESYDKLTLVQPTLEVIEAAAKLRSWFASQGLFKWELDGVCSSSLYLKVLHEKENLKENLDKETERAEMLLKLVCDLRREMDEDCAKLRKTIIDLCAKLDSKKYD